MSAPTLVFSEKQFRDANRSWGCNCGPAALAFALGCSLDTVRPYIPMFDERRYISPTMMKQALFGLAVEFEVIRAPQYSDIGHSLTALVRIQWTGPWTRPKPQRWAGKFTHWIATWDDGGVTNVFDCNGGIRSLKSWQADICPLLMHSYAACDGWKPANVWRLLR